MAEKRISVIGQGKVGSTMTACFASKGYSVTGVDIDPALVEHVKHHRAVFQEPHVQEFMTAHGERITATLSVEEAIKNSDITFIIVPTPSLPSGGFSAQYVCDACTEIGKALKSKKSWHLVVVTSTVLPGTTEQEVIPALEKASGKKCGKDFDFCYSPLFIALGNVAMNILKPDFVLVGESTPRAGETLEKFYRSVIDNKASVQRMNIINAELSKITVNAYVTTKISFANQLAEICEGLPGANADVVAKAIGCDTRIGSKYLKAGTAFGGPCFPRDNRAYQYTAKLAGTDAPIAAATDAINLRQAGRLKSLILQHMNRGGGIGILGMAYKPDTPVLDESPGIHLAHILVDQGYKVYCFDTMANSEVQKLKMKNLEVMPSVEAVVKKSDVIVIAQPVAAYKFASEIALKKTVIDCWGILDQADWSGKANRLQIGQSQGAHTETIWLTGE